MSQDSLRMCSQCGAQNPVTQAFCSHCGAKQDMGGASSSAEYGTPSSQSNPYYQASSPYQEPSTNYSGSSPIYQQQGYQQQGYQQQGYQQQGYQQPYQPIPPYAQAQPTTGGTGASSGIVAA